MNNLRDKIAIVGIGETDYVKKSDRPVKEVIIEAVTKALDDAKIKPSEVDSVITEGGFTTPFLGPTELGYNLGFTCRYIDSAPGAGGGNVGSPLNAAMAITTGQAKVVLTYFCNNYGTLRRRAYTYAGHGNIEKDNFEIAYGLFGAPVHWAMRARRYMHEYGLTSKQLASIALNQRRNAVLNGKGLMKKPITYEDYENSPIVCDPLRLLDYTPVNDGACAWVLTSAERAKDCPHVPVYVMGSAYGYYAMTAADIEVNGGNYIHKPPEKIALDAALKMAGISQKDLDFAEIYDAYTIFLLTMVETLGFCKVGEGGAFFESGIPSLEGALPINTNGGHLSHSYMFGASHVIEAVRQLRHEADACQIKKADIGLVSGGGGGTMGAATILRRG